MVLHHLLVVTPTLVRRAALDRLAHGRINLQDSPKLFRAPHHLLVLSQKVHVGNILFNLPPRIVKTFLFHLRLFHCFAFNIMLFTFHPFHRRKLIRTLVIEEIILVLSSGGVQPRASIE
jgi:hypothetical protein